MDFLGKIEWNDISAFRSQLMGVAAIWVLLFHSFVSHWGWGGVDIFIFVSALGCYRSLSSDERFKVFYKKRLMRIFPTYFAILGCIHLCCYVLASIIPESAEKFVYPHSLWDAICFYTTLGFWIPNEGACHYEWYVPTIIFFYFCMPFLYKGIRSITHKFHYNMGIVLPIAVAMAYFVSFFIGYLLEWKQCDLGRYNLALNRIISSRLCYGFVNLAKEQYGGGKTIHAFNCYRIDCIGSI